MRARGSGSAVEDVVQAVEETFRPRALLRHVVLLALALWFNVLLALVRHPGAPDKAFLGAFFFIALFSSCWLYYHHLAIAISGELLICRGFLRDRGMRLDDILHVDVHPGPLGTTYDVIGRGGFVRFSSLFADHKRLLELIVNRAHLDQKR
jgi:hypothetical protein